MHTPPLPFDASQRLFLLKEGVDPQAAVHPERFHAIRQDGGQRKSEEPAAPDDQWWSVLPRQDLLAGASAGRRLDRVALTTDAGLGKSYNLAWLRYELNDPAHRQPAFLLAVGDMANPADLIARKLATLVRNSPGNASLDARRLCADLHRLRDRGRLTLLFDGLDMAGDANVEGLAQLLDPRSEWGRCRIVVAGRPFALERYWARLFADKPWQFVQIGEFSAKQQRRALGQLSDGRSRYDVIPREARSILTIPRVLEYLQPLGEVELEKLHTVADVYWQACRYMLRQALGRDVDVFTWQRLLALLGAAAFTMYAQTERHAETDELRPNLDRVAALDMPSFLEDVMGRLGRVLPRYDEARFMADLAELSRLNAILNHGWLDVNSLGGVGEDCLWRNASLQEFFAAYWATRWGGEEDASRLHEWVVNPSSHGNRAFYWFWRYASEMPDEAILPGSKKAPTAWIAAMTPLYQAPKDADRQLIRSTEFIHRSWDRMERLNAAPLRAFLQEFPALLKQKNAVAVELDGTFEPIPAGTFWMGALDGEADAYRDERPRHQVTLSAFRMNRHAVTNAQYELFDPGHRRHRGRFDGDKNHKCNDDRRPVVNVSWYDAICFAQWTGNHLPTEAQWEYACRGGASPYQVFHFGDTLTSRQANFDGRHPYGVEDKGDYLQCTTEVGSYGKNPFGLYDMHGNVWEWCEDWYAACPPDAAPQRDPVNREAASARVLRGGSWYPNGWRCRSALRGGDEPDVRDRHCGFRLAAVPASLEPSKQARAGAGASGAEARRRSGAEPEVP